MIKVLLDFSFFFARALKFLLKTCISRRLITRVYHKKYTPIMFIYVLLEKIYLGILYTLLLRVYITPGTKKMTSVFLFTINYRY